jgi:glycosyltransferase involved in cell wall biosynthesis
MRILLIAYDFPPIPSPQSLRWAYLARELDRQGHQVNVLAADIPGYGSGGLPVLPETIRVHRVWPGFLTSGRRSLGGVRVDLGVPYWSAETPAPTVAIEPAPAVAIGDVEPAPVQLNWKGNLYFGAKSLLPRAPSFSVRHGLLGTARRWASAWMFPDYRAEWSFWARRELRHILKSHAPELVITSHEPAFTLPLGMEAKRRGFRWVADMGDPVLAPYTPARWRKRAFELEREVCAHADLVTVTSERTISVLEERHGVQRSRFHLLTQGFDAERPSEIARSPGGGFEGDRLELLYTGSFYSFRRIDALLDAVLETDSVRLTVATIAPPDVLLEAQRRHPGKVRIVGFLPHDKALDLQRGCDVLVNIANDDPMQVPGKVYEYLGAGVRILHVGGGADAATELLSRSGVGVSASNDARALSAVLREWRDEKLKTGERLTCKGTQSFNLHVHSWQALAEGLADSIERARQSG